jgi:CubicO group peptidase (beta-lactamase class C family)
MPYADLVQREIWGHLGAEADASMTVSSQGTPASHGGMSSTLRDLARYGLLFTPSWRTVSQTCVIPATYLRTIQRGGRPELFETGTSGRAAIALLGERPRHHTYQWDLVMEDGEFFKAGYHGQGLWISPTRDLVIAYFGHGAPATAATKLARAIVLSGLFPHDSLC